MIVDTSAMLAYFNRREPAYEAVAAVLDSAGEPLVYSPLVLAELDYLILTRRGVAAELAVVAALSRPAWRLAVVGDDDIQEARRVLERYADTPIGLADALNVVLADRFSTDTLATLDHRHFSFVSTPSGPPLTLLP